MYRENKIKYSFSEIRYLADSMQIPGRQTQILRVKIRLLYLQIPSLERDIFFFCTAWDGFLFISSVFCWLLLISCIKIVRHAFLPREPNYSVFQKKI